MSPFADRETGALASGLAAVLMWSTVATGFKLALAVVAPLQLLLAATVVSTIVFALAATATGSWQLDRRSLRQAALFGLANPFLYYMILFEAYDRLPAQIAQPLNYTWAITLALLAVPVLGQPLTKRTIAGILVSYLGVLVLLTQGTVTSLRETDWLGVALALLSTVVWACYWLANARTSLNPLSLMAVSFACALPLVAAACFLGPGWPPLTWETASYGLWIGLFEMGAAFLLWQRALHLTRSAARIGQLIFLSPFISLVLIDQVLGETIHMTSVAGLAIIVAGLLITKKPGTA